MTVRDAAVRLEISKSLVYRLIEEGRLPCVRIGQLGRRGKIVIREKDIEALLKECEVRQGD
jgi:excisionase family DNA binding protein